jgi:hypothetical protein
MIDAEIPHSPRIARLADAGLLAERAADLSEFADLKAWASTMWPTVAAIPSQTHLPRAAGLAPREKVLDSTLHQLVDEFEDTRRVSGAKKLQSTHKIWIVDHPYERYVGTPQVLTQPTERATTTEGADGSEIPQSLRPDSRRSPTNCMTRARHSGQDRKVRLARNPSERNALCRKVDSRNSPPCCKPGARLDVTAFMVRPPCRIPVGRWRQTTDKIGNVVEIH